MDDRDGLSSLLALLLVKHPSDCLQALRSHFGTVRAVLDAPPDEVRRAACLPAGVENQLVWCRRVVEAFAAPILDGLDPAGLRALWCLRIGGLRYEVVEIACLDPAGRLLPAGMVRIASGTPLRAAFRPRQVLEAGLRAEAAGVIVAHNHPGGHLEPSEQDKILTRALAVAGGSVELTLVDHLIVGPTAVFSFRDAGLV